MYRDGEGTQWNMNDFDSDLQGHLVLLLTSALLVWWFFLHNDLNTSVQDCQIQPCIMTQDMLRIPVKYEWPWLWPSRSFDTFTDQCTPYVDACPHNNYIEQGDFYALPPPPPKVRGAYWIHSARQSVCPSILLILSCPLIWKKSSYSDVPRSFNGISLTNCPAYSGQPLSPSYICWKKHLRKVVSWWTIFIGI